MRKQDTTYSGVNVRGGLEVRRRQHGDDTHQDGLDAVDGLPALVCGHDREGSIRWPDVRWRHSWRGQGKMWLHVPAVSWGFMGSTPGGCRMEMHTFPSGYTTQGGEGASGGSKSTVSPWPSVPACLAGWAYRWGATSCSRTSSQGVPEGSRSGMSGTPGSSRPRCGT